MIPSLSPSERERFAAAAAYERAVRVAAYPKHVESGKVSQQEADADIAAWATLAELFDRGGTDRETSWSELHFYTSRHFQALEQDVDAATARGDQPGEKLRERWATAAAIQAVIERHKFLVDDCNVLLRQRAAAARQAA